jgi:hypothetical protein
MNTPFVTFYYDYDNSSYYKNAADKLKNTIEELGGKLFVYSPILDGEYNSNCLIKPTIILQCLNEQKEDIIWIDADCTVNVLPTELDNLNYDLAAVARIHDGITPHSALIRFKYNPSTLQFVKRWIDKCDSKLEEAKIGMFKGGDHHLFIETLKESKENVLCAMLPSYVACSVNKNAKVFINISPGGLNGV